MEEKLRLKESSYLLGGWGVGFKMILVHNQYLSLNMAAILPPRPLHHCRPVNSVLQSQTMLTPQMHAGKQNYGFVRVHHHNVI